MSPAIAHGGVVLIGLLVILEGIGLATYPKMFAFLAGPGAGRKSAQVWTRYQGLGFMLLGLAFTMAGVQRTGDEVLVVVLATVACLMFSMAVLRRAQIHEDDLHRHHQATETTA
jgi:uncharacterized protein YjeT (DUF2065 family)